MGVKLDDIRYAEYAIAILVGRTGGYMQDIRCYITSDYWLRFYRGKVYLFKITEGSSVSCHIHRGKTTNVLFYDITELVPLSREMLDGLFSVAQYMYRSHAKDISVKELIGSVRGKTKSIQWCLEKIEKDVYDSRLTDWLKTVPSEMIHVPMRSLPDILSKDVAIQSAAYLGGLHELAFKHREKLDLITNYQESKGRNKTMIYVIAFAMIGVLLIGYFAYGVQSGSIDISGIPGLSSLMPSVQSGPGAANVDVCSPESIRANYQGGVDAAVDIYLGILPCDPKEIDGAIGEIIRQQDPALVEWMAKNQDIVGGGPLDAMSDAVQELAP